MTGQSDDESGPVLRVLSSDEVEEPVDNGGEKREKPSEDDEEEGEESDMVGRGKEKVRARCAGTIRTRRQMERQPPRPSGGALETRVVRVDLRWEAAGVSKPEARATGGKPGATIETWSHWIGARFVSVDVVVGAGGMGLRGRRSVGHRQPFRR